MAECLGHLRFLLLLFSILPVSPQVQTENARDVAQENTKTLVSSISAWDNASSSIDGDASTCMQTHEEKAPWWTLDLGADNVRTIVGLYIDAGTDSVLEHMEIWVGDKRGDSTGNGFCKTYMPPLEGQSAAHITCIKPIQGRFITIKLLDRLQLRLCEVKVYECLEGYFGATCSKECHCEHGPTACPRTTGECPCAAGWTGPSCQQACAEGTFGENCAGTCHCKGDVACNRTTGHCPSDECMDTWLGEACQTKLPDMGNHIYRPISVEKTSTSITLDWMAWTGPVEQNARLIYWIEFKPYVALKRDQVTKAEYSWLRWKTAVPATGELYQKMNVLGLSTNRNYVFRVVPYVHGVQGIPSPEGGPYKTRCTDPDPPRIEGVEAVVDRTHDPPVALLTIKWLPPSRHFVNCDNIKVYKISYRPDKGQWTSLLASNEMDTKNITGLNLNVKYDIKVSAINNEDYVSESNTVHEVTRDDIALPTIHRDNVNNGIVVGIVISLLLVMAVCIAGFLYRRRRTKYSSIPIKDDKTEVDMPLNNANGTVVKVEIPEDSSNSDMNDSGVVDGSASENTPSSVNDTLADSVPQEEKNPFPKVVQPDIDRSIVVEDLEAYVMARRPNDCDGLRKEYEEIPMGFIDRYDHGRLSENKHKNRFINIIAYDHSRVVLDKMEGDPDSDYINANWIDGYKKPQNYVAAQGCNKYTIQDMWRMVWQLQSGRIIMVTNLVENGKRKCDQYWPDVGEKNYNGIDVRIVDTEQTSDFVIRSFELQKGDEKRSVKQFHFIAWPDHGVPTRAGPIIAFRRKVRSYDESHTGPMLIHCSAGVGRTGTFIALDFLLDRAKAEGIVDIYGLVWDMRRNRVNMIQTVEQYIFVYDALLEALKAGNTAIGCSEFRDEFERLKEVDPTTGKSKLQEQFATLQLMSPKVKAEDCKSGSLPENIDKNRCKDILPADRHRPYLMVRVDGTNDYINAVFLDGFLKRNAYIITQMPLPHTVIDFWRMVYEHGCSSIVMLNSMEDEDETYGQYWLDEEGCECGPFVIEPISTDTTNKNVVVRELKLTYEPQSPSVLPSRKEEKPHMIGQFQMTCWPNDSLGPTSKQALINLIEVVERWQQKTGDGPVLVHCRDGVTKSGLYTAVSCIWEKMKVDQEVDIFHAVKHLRYHRPQILQDQEQYLFCYEMVLAYMAEFETYANFR